MARRINRRPKLRGPVVKSNDVYTEPAQVKGATKADYDDELKAEEKTAPPPKG